MKRLTYSAIAFALLAFTGTNVSVAKDKPTKPKENRVLMCTYVPGGDPYEIYVKDKDVDDHLAEGDTLGACDIVVPMVG